MAEEKETIDRVREIIVDELGSDPAEVTPNANLVDDLGADSLDLVNMVMCFEEEYEIEIPDDDAEKLTTVKAIVDYLDAHKE